MTSICIECNHESDRPRPVDGAYLCRSCILTVCGGCVPEWISRGDGSPVYWFHCICGREVRRGTYKVPWEWRGMNHARWRLAVEGIADAGVMLCLECASAAGIGTPSQDRELPSNVLAYRPRPRRSGRSLERRRPS